MDKTYLYIYEKLYQHLYKFSISGNIDSKNAIMNLKKKVSGTKDKSLEHIYEMIVRAVRLERDEFEQKSRESEITVICGMMMINCICFLHCVKYTNTFFRIMTR